MQRLLKRTAQAQRQAVRRAKQRAQKAKDAENGHNKNRSIEAFAEVRENLRDARQAMKDGWELGPLAPKRDLGFNHYANINDDSRTNWAVHGYSKAQAEVAEKRCAWAGGLKKLNLAPKDRVVILDGPDKGKIDRIESIDTSIGTVKLEKFHHAVLSRPEYDIQNEDISMPIPVSSIRLVYPITNPDTGVTRDVIINELKAIPPDMRSQNMSFDRWHYGKKWDRLVPGINVIIPWPAVEAPEAKATEADTVREQVTERTFYYNLTEPPLPSTVLDELRNRYSRFRTRHEPEYLQAKAAEEEAKKSRHKLLKFMQTPLEEFHEKQRKEREAQGEPELTQDMLEKIGEVMAKNKAAALAEAGVTQESSVTTSTSKPDAQ